MIQVITGKRGSGKTKILLGMIDDAVKATNGDIICIEKCMKLTYSVNHKVRLVDAERYNINGFDMFYGFVAGVLAGNYDINVPGILVDDPQYLRGYKNSMSDANFVKDVSTSEIVWLADGISSEDISRQQIAITGAGTGDGLKGISQAYMVHVGRANILTLNGSVTSVANEGIYDFYQPTTAGGPKHYSLRGANYRVQGSGDGISTRAISTTW